MRIFSDTDVKILTGAAAVVVALFMIGAYAHCETKKVTATFVNRSGYDLTMVVDGVEMCTAQSGQECMAVVLPGSHVIEAEYGSTPLPETRRELDKARDFQYAVCKRGDHDKACYQ